MKTSELVLVSVSWDGVTVTVDGEIKRVSWDNLRAAATQDDAGLRAVYAGLLEDAKRMARESKRVKVRVANLNGGPDDLGGRTWAAHVVTMGGETLSVRTVAADWGQTGTKSYAMRDAEEAKKVLPQRGYTVEM